MGVQQFQAGFNQSVTVNSTGFCISNSTWIETNDVLDVTGTCSAGKHQFIKGLSGVTGSFDLFFDTGNPVVLNAGDYFSVSNVLGGTGAQGLSCNTCIVVSRAYTAPVPGAITVTVSYNTSGPYTISTV
jgi:hypothetical protein